MKRQPQRSTLLPYATLFRSGRCVPEDLGGRLAPVVALQQRREVGPAAVRRQTRPSVEGVGSDGGGLGDAKSTRLNSSHANNSYGVFCFEIKTGKSYCIRRFG